MPPKKSLDEMNRLTPREEEILALVAAGLSDRAIAAQLWISYFTVIQHVRSIRGKLDVRSRQAAAAWWQQRECRECWERTNERGQW